MLEQSQRVLLVGARMVELDVPPAEVLWWYTPGGGVDSGESLRAAAVRELSEEIGMQITETDLEGPVWFPALEARYLGVDIDTRETFFVLRNVEHVVDVSGQTELERLEDQPFRRRPELSATGMSARPEPTQGHPATVGSSQTSPVGRDPVVRVASRVLVIDTDKRILLFGGPSLSKGIRSARRWRNRSETTGILGRDLSFVTGYRPSAGLWHHEGLLAGDLVVRQRPPGLVGRLPCCPRINPRPTQNGHAMNTLDALDAESLRDDIPDFRPGDSVKVHVRVVEGNRSRIQVFQGVVLRRQGGGIRETFTVRKISFGVGVERTFPVHTPVVEKIEIVTRGDVRRAKLYYLRDLRGKAAKIKEKRDTATR